MAKWDQVAYNQYLVTPLNAALSMLAVLSLFFALVYMLHSLRNWEEPEEAVKSG